MDRQVAVEVPFKALVGGLWRTDAVPPLCGPAESHRDVSQESERERVG